MFLGILKYFLEKFKKMLLGISEYFLEKLKNLPLIKPLFHFSKKYHLQAFPKIGTLWFMSTLPVFLSVAFTQKAQEAGGDEFLNRLSTSFSAPEQFVYAASFLPPVIYIIIERYIEADITGSLSTKFKVSVRRVFDGYWPVFIIACLILFLTIITYSGTKTNFADLQNTYFYQLAVSSAPWCYGFSLYCWYLSILDGLPEISNYITETKEAEEELSGLFSNRIKSRETING